MSIIQSLPFLSPATPELVADIGVTPEAIFTRLDLITTGVRIIENVKAQLYQSPVLVNMGHDFRVSDTVAALMNPVAQSSEYSRDLERHMRAQMLQPSASVREVSNLPSGHTILDGEVMALQDAQIDLMTTENTALSDTALSDTVTVAAVVPDNVVSLSARRTYPSGLDADAIGLTAKNEAILGEEARAHLAEAA